MTLLTTKLHFSPLYQQNKGDSPGRENLCLFQRSGRTRTDPRHRGLLQRERQWLNGGEAKVNVAWEALQSMLRGDCVITLAFSAYPIDLSRSLRAPDSPIPLSAFCRDFPWKKAADIKPRKKRGPSRSQYPNCGKRRASMRTDRAIRRQPQFGSQVCASTVASAKRKSQACLCVTVRIGSGARTPEGDSIGRTERIHPTGEHKPTQKTSSKRRLVRKNKQSAARLRDGA